MKPFLPLATFVGTFVVYALTMARTHGGDSPFILAEAVEGRWFHPSHLLIRGLVALAVNLTRALTPDVSPYTPAVLVSGTIAGALAAALYHQLLRRLTRSEVIPMATALVLVFTASWWNVATTLELHLAPAVLVFLTALLLARSTTSNRPILAAMLAGAAQALACSFHLIAAGALVAGVAVLALQRRPLRTRVGMVAAFAGAVCVVIVLLYGTATLISLEGLDPTMENLRRKAVFPMAAAPPTLLAGGSAAQHLWRGAGDSIASARSAGALGANLLTALLIVVPAGALALLPRLWRRHRGFALFPFLWLSGAIFLVVRVEPGNTEYYVMPLAALGMLLALLWEEVCSTWPGRAAPRVAYGIAALALACVLAKGNAGFIAARMTSPTGDPVGPPVEREDRTGSPTGAPPGVPPSREEGPRGPPPAGGPPDKRRGIER